MWDTAPTVCAGPRNQYSRGGRQAPEVQAAERECCVLLQASKPSPKENRCTHTLSEVSAPVAEGWEKGWHFCRAGSSMKLCSCAEGAAVGGWGRPGSLTLSVRLGGYSLGRRGKPLNQNKEIYKGMQQQRRRGRR